MWSAVRSRVGSGRAVKRDRAFHSATAKAAIGTRRQGWSRSAATSPADHSTAAAVRYRAIRRRSFRPRARTSMTKPRCTAWPPEGTPPTMMITER